MPANNAFSLVCADGVEPARVRQWLLFLHGILGRGSNLRTIARKVLAAHPAWGIALVDLRGHGSSPITKGFAAPHTVAAAAADLIALELALPGPVRGVLGHSFGGKVALSYLQRRGGTLSHVIDVDASPAARHLSADRSSTVAIIELLERLPPLLPSRAALAERVVELGLGRPLGDWLAMNLEPQMGADGAVYRLSLDMPAIRAMLEDYLALDLWPVVEHLPDETRLDVIIGDLGGVFPPEDRARLEAARAAQPEQLVVHTLATGHWVHVDDPDGLVRVVIEALTER